MLFQKPLQCLTSPLTSPLVSPVGYGGNLVQDDVETRYSQTEREALAVVWACEQFDIYVRGAPFKVVTDHKPLVHIWMKPNPPLRIARWALRLQLYDALIEYRPGHDNPADYMSRHPSKQNILSSREEKMAEDYVQFISQTSLPNALTIEEVQLATEQDSTLQVVIKMIQTGKWCDIKLYEGSTTVTHSALLQFRNVREELTVNHSANPILRDSRIVILSSLQARVVLLAHEEHQGESKTKALLRSKVWFPGIDAAAAEVVQRCIPCQANTSRRRVEPLNMSDLPRGHLLNLVLISVAHSRQANTYL